MKLVRTVRFLSRLVRASGPGDAVARGVGGLQCRVRWDRLFADLEARFEDLADEQAAAEQADRDRVATGAVTLVQRLGGAVGQPVRVAVIGGSRHDGVLRRIGHDFLLVEDDAGRDVLISLVAVAAVGGLTARTAPPSPDRPTRLDLRRALRSIARDRAVVALSIGSGAVGSGGSASDGSPVVTELVGTLDRVGADFLEVAIHPVGEPRRAGLVRGVSLVPLTAVRVVRTIPVG